MFRGDSRRNKKKHYENFILDSIQFARILPQIKNCNQKSLRGNKTNLERNFLMSNVKPYTDEQLLNRVESLESFKYFPEDYWLCGVRSNEDAFNKTDDKFYLFKGKQFIKVFAGTTNGGKNLLNPKNPRGMAVIVADRIYYDVWQQDFHNGAKNKVWAWCQRSVAFLVARDNDRDTKTEILGKPKWEICGLNFHPMSYIFGNKLVKLTIDGNSDGCQCPNKRTDFDEVMKLTKNQDRLTYCLLNEF